MPHFLLVHGAWHGGWCWKKVAPLLCKHGCNVVTPTLSGLGERSHLLTSEINLLTHINDIVQILKYRDLRDVVLIGHSYAGMVISGVAEILPERLARLVYVDAPVPLNGQSAIDLLPGLPSFVREITLPAGKVPVILPPSPESFGVSDPEDIVWMKELLTPMPFNCLNQGIRIANPLVAKLDKSYILCTIPYSDESEIAHITAFRRAKSEGWDCRKIDAPHDMMITHASALSKMLLECAQIT